MDHTLFAKTAKFMSLENLYEYGMIVHHKTNDSQELLGRQSTVLLKQES